MIGQLVIVLRMMVSHGFISQKVLLIKMIPIIKDKLGNVFDAGNYRSIALGSVILKVLEILNIYVFGDILYGGANQFRFQRGSNTLSCAWLFLETVDSFLRRGSKVFCAVMDCTKAFDLVSHGKLANKLIEAEYPPLYLRTIITSYRTQCATVDWNGMISEKFDVKNGVRHGGS